MRNDLHPLLILRFQDPMADDPHFGVLLLLVLRLEALLLEAERLVHLVLLLLLLLMEGAAPALDLFVEYLEGGVPLRETVHLPFVEAEQRVMVGDPSWELATVVVVIDGRQAHRAAALEGVLEAAACGVARLGYVVDGFAVFGTSLVDETAVLVFIAGQAAAVPLRDFAD